MTTFRPWLTVLVAVATGLAAAASWVVSGWYLTPRMPGEIQVTLGNAPVGGPFALIDQAGRPVTDAALRGAPFVLYFGYSRDVDVTPAALGVLAAALDALASKSGPMRVVFVSLDPVFDTPERLSAFLSKQSSRIVGLTGTQAEIDQVARAYRLYFRRIPDAALPNGHSIEFLSHYYVVGADGGFRAVIPHTTSSGELADAILRAVK